MQSAARVEFAAALRADCRAFDVFFDGQLITAFAAQNGASFAFGALPDLRRMRRVFGVTLETWKPTLAAFEFNGDNVERAVVMNAARPGVNIDAVNFDAVNRHRAF